MNEASYDLVLVDADAASIIEYVEHALRLVRVGGTVLIPHALWRIIKFDNCKIRINTDNFTELYLFKKLNCRFVKFYVINSSKNRCVKIKTLFHN